MKRTGWLLLALLVSSNCLAPAAEPLRLDCFGDPLPKGAVARMGTVRFRHAGAVRSIAYSPDGKTIASAGDDKVVRIWDAESGKELRVLKGHKDTIHQVAFSPEGKRILSTSSDRTARLWDPMTGGKISATKYPGKSFAAAFSPDGKVLAVAAGQPPDICLRDVSTDKVLRHWRGGTAGTIDALAFSPDGKMLAAGGFTEVADNSALGLEIRKAASPGH